MIEVVGAAIITDGKCLIARRKGDRPFAALWEFPGGKVEEGESREAALIREIQEELGAHIEVDDELASGTARHGNKTICLHIFASRLVPLKQELTLLDHDEFVWATEDQLPSFHFADADIPCLPAVAARMRQSAVAPSSRSPRLADVTPGNDGV